ncbi:hypothetical protein NE237_032345 [Protea cynaroides]|uniref:Uncharacterized protein n=1 Tax=Protea cynaroides TaxID=273540 RepID=A0A9Q0R304_9MAGN|nr:hypothetical protein NE237_032345 [Protea cynaroides]
MFLHSEMVLEWPKSISVPNKIELSSLKRLSSTSVREALSVLKCKPSSSSQCTVVFFPWLRNLLWSLSLSTSTTLYNQELHQQ